MARIQYVAEDHSETNPLALGSTSTGIHTKGSQAQDTLITDVRASGSLIVFMQRSAKERQLFGPVPARSLL